MWDTAVRSRLKTHRFLLLRFVRRRDSFSCFSCFPFRYGLMKSCWRWSEDSRPSLRELHSRLETAARTANDKAVLQVPELVVPELYAAVAGVSVESLSYSYSILWRSWGSTHFWEIIYSWNQFLQEQRQDFLVGHKGRNGTWILHLPLHISPETWNDARWGCTQHIPSRLRSTVSFLLSQSWRCRVDGMDRVNAREVLQVCSVRRSMAQISWSLPPQAGFLWNMLLSRLL